MREEGSGVIKDFLKNWRRLVLFWIRGQGTVGGVEWWRERDPMRCKEPEAERRQLGSDRSHLGGERGQLGGGTEVRNSLE